VPAPAEAVAGERTGVQASWVEQFAGYVLERQLGAGAMGVVYQARHPQLGTSYALKLLRTELSTPQDVLRFQRELESMAAVSDHPNVVRIHTGGQAQGRLYYVMDLIDGEDLAAVVARGRLEPKEAARLVEGVAGAVATLHGRGLIHRDIKPENVILTQEGVPLLTAFGLARLFSDGANRLTVTGELVGTPSYMAPEQALGSTDLTPKVDVYALGALLYTLLSGEPPVGGNSKLMVLSKVASGEITPLSSAAPDAPQALAEVCTRALGLAPEDRPSAAQLAQELAAFRSGGGGGLSAGTAARGRLALALFVLVGLILGGVGVAVHLSRQATASGEAAALAETALRDAALGAARQAVRTGAPSSEAVAGLVQLRTSLAPDDPGAFELRSECLALEGELSLLAGALEPARAALAGLEGLSDARAKSPQDARDRHDALATLLAARLALAEGETTGVVSLLRRLAEAEEALERPDLGVLRMRLALSAKRLDEAEALLERDGVTPAMRCEYHLAKGELDTAGALLDQVEDRRLHARVHLARGMAALRNNEPEQTHAWLLRAGEPVRTLAERAEAKAELDRYVRQLRDAALKREQFGSNPDLAPKKAAKIVRLLYAHASLKALEPEHRLGGRDQAAAEDWGLVLMKHLTREHLRVALDVFADPGQLLYGYGKFLKQKGIPADDVDLAIVRRALKTSETHRKDAWPDVAKDYTNVLVARQDEDTLRAFREQLVAHPLVEPRLLVNLDLGLAQAFWRTQRIPEALEVFDQVFETANPSQQTFIEGERCFLHANLYRSGGRPQDRAAALAAGRAYVEDYRPVGKDTDWRRVEVAVILAELELEGDAPPERVIADLDGAPETQRFPRVATLRALAALRLEDPSTRAAELEQTLPRLRRRLEEELNYRSGKIKAGKDVETNRDAKTTLERALADHLPALKRAIERRDWATAEAVVAQVHGQITW
jgi:serine/threonine-protein kinase